MQTLVFYMKKPYPQNANIHFYWKNHIRKMQTLIFIWKSTRTRRRHATHVAKRFSKACQDRYAPAKIIFWSNWNSRRKPDPLLCRSGTGQVRSGTSQARYRSAQFRSDQTKNCGFDYPMTADQDYSKSGFAENTITLGVNMCTHNIKITYENDIPCGQIRITQNLDSQQ